MNYSTVKWFSCGVFVALIFLVPNPTTLPTYVKVICGSAGVSFVTASAILRWPSGDHN